MLLLDIYETDVGAGSILLHSVSRKRNIRFQPPAVCVTPQGHELLSHSAQLYHCWYFDRCFVVGVIDDIASVSSPVVSSNGAKKCARDYNSVSTECKSVL